MNIKKHFTKKHKVYSSEHVSWRERLGEDARIGWAVIITVSFVVTFILAAYAGKLFFLINSGGIKAPQSKTVPLASAGFDPVRLDALVAGFNSRASTTAQLDKGYSGPADPSQ
jgi:hypothetical protein